MKNPTPQQEKLMHQEQDRLTFQPTTEEETVKFAFVLYIVTLIRYPFILLCRFITGEK
jgi:hypothetical protein